MNSKILHTILRTVRSVLIKVFWLFPIKDYIVFESNPDFNDEGYWICKRFMNEDKQKYHIVWILQDRSLQNKPSEWSIDYIFWYPKSLREWIKKWYVLSTARAIIDTCNFVYKQRAGQFRFHGTHGMPLKASKNYFSLMGDLDYLNAGASFGKDYFISLGIDSKKIVCLGLARNDQLAKSNKLFRTKYQIPDKSKMILWMPTYRQHISNNPNVSINTVEANQTGLPILKTEKELEEINKILQYNNSYLVLKIHQSQNTGLMTVNNMSNIIICETKDLYDIGVQLYEVIGEFDALITDYSSVYYDYLLLDRPIAITVDDLDYMKSKIGFVFDDFKSSIKGFYVNSVEDFSQFVIRVVNDDNSLINEISGCKCKYNDITDFSSSDRIYKFVNEHLKERDEK